MRDFVKRLFDLVASALGLLLLSPLFLWVALRIKKEDGGPVFFRQVRVGKAGKCFRIHKFRTMAVNTEGQGKITVGADKRITTCGQFLRRYKIDELPQLMDVFKGDMSLVGPRPEVPEFMERYAPEIRAQILLVKPGITDKASIEMIDENELLGQYADPHQAYIDKIMPLKAKYYIEYAQSHSFWGDIGIIFATLRKIIVRS